MVVSGARSLSWSGASPDAKPGQGLWKAMRRKNSNPEIAERARRKRRRTPGGQHLFSVTPVTPLRPLGWRLVLVAAMRLRCCLPSATIFPARQLATRHSTLPAVTGTTAIDGGMQLVSRFVDTPMVQPRELIGGINSHFPLAFCHFCVKPLLQTNDLVGFMSVFGHFFACQILPNFTKFYQIRPKVCSEGPQTGTLRGVFLDRFI